MSLDSRNKQRIVILGGGTAGWISATAMIDRWADKAIDITLIESPAIGTVTPEAVDSGARHPLSGRPRSAIPQKARPCR